MTGIASGRVLFLQKKLKDLMEAYDEYIELLGQELDETVPIAYNHHWRSDKYEKGEAARAKIKQVKERK